jgi:hypothetical protein
LPNKPRPKIGLLYLFIIIFILFFKKKKKGGMRRWADGGHGTMGREFELLRNVD